MQKALNRSRRIGIIPLLGSSFLCFGTICANIDAPVMPSGPPAEPDEQVLGYHPEMPVDLAPEEVVSETSEPHVEIIASTVEGLAPLSVEFAALATDDPSSETWYDWDFNDGHNAEGQYVSHVFQVPGTYTVAVCVTISSALTSTTTCNNKVVTAAEAVAAAPTVDALGGNELESLATGALAVTPETASAADGPVSGPFSPSDFAYTLLNTGAQSINWTATRTQPWVSLSKSSGILEAGASDTVTVLINGIAEGLAADNYSDVVAFTNTTNGDGTSTREVSLNVAPAGGSEEGESRLPGFPGAQGFGAYARGGRGGRVLHVTTLADYDRQARERVIPGSLRWALEEVSGPRTVLFQTGGTIVLKSPVVLKGEQGSYVTIAGQSAPGDGIQIAGYGLVIREGAHDIIIRYLRIRPGVTAADRWIDPDGSGPLPAYLEKWNTDALTIFGPLGRTVCDVIVDHCSLQWAIDENANVWDAAERITFQHCIFAEGSTFGHYGSPEEYPYNHSFGFLAGGELREECSEYLTLHHNLFMNNQGRNPQFTANGGTIDFVNNVMYNCAGSAVRVYRMRNRVAVGPRVNIVGNHYLWGPSDMTRRWRMVGLQVIDNPSILAVDDASVYVYDNLDSYRTDGTTDDGEVLFEGSNPGREPGDPMYNLLMRKRRAQPWPTPGIPVNAEPASAVLDSVKRNAGARFPRLDPVDARLLDELSSGRGEIGFGSQQAVLRHPRLDSGTPLEDSDGDGMPDAYELSVGLDPHDLNDGNQDRNDDGYTNVEEYLNSLVAERTPS